MQTNSKKISFRRTTGVKVARIIVAILATFFAGNALAAVSATSAVGIINNPATTAAVQILPPTTAMYPGESMLAVAGYPALVKFSKGDATKPLVIFIPGNNSLGRISYGYPGGNPKDFLAYWLNQAGYSFLSISYPMDNPVYPNPKNYAQLSVADYAKQVAAITQYYVNTYHLANKIIVLMWSGGGRAAVNINQEMKKSNLNLDFGVSLAATPPLGGVSGINHPSIAKKFPMDADGYLDDVLYKNLLQQISVENKLNGKIIIPENIYHSQFVGNSPVQFYNPFIKYDGKQLVVDESGMKANQYYQNYAEYPIVTSIVGDNQIDSLHSILGVSAWNFINQQSLYLRNLNLQYTNLSASQWQNLQATMSSIPSEFTRFVTGSHFFFIGEKGAKATVKALQSEQHSVDKVNSELANPAYKVSNPWPI